MIQKGMTSLKQWLTGFKGFILDIPILFSYKCPSQYTPDAQRLAMRATHTTSVTITD